MSRISSISLSVLALIYLNYCYFVTWLSRRVTFAPPLYSSFGINVLIIV